MDIGAYALRTWGERPDHSLSQMILKPVAKYWPTTQLLAVPATTFGPTFVAWSTVSTLCFTDVSREAFWFPASCTNACCRQDTSLATKTKRNRPPLRQQRLHV